MNAQYYYAKSKAIELLFVALTVCPIAISAQAISTSAWIEDFRQLKREMSLHYANLEWAIEERGLDLKQLSQTTELKLNSAKNDAEARDIIAGFLREFGDAHVGVDWKLATAAEKPENENGTPQSLCSRLGYKPSSFIRPGVAFSSLKNFSQPSLEQSRYFPAGVLNLANGRKIGVIRIGLFMENLFPELCEQAAAEMGVKPGSECGDECQKKISQKVSNQFTKIFAKQVRNLKDLKIDSLLVDITSNGGGTSWYEPAAKTLSSKEARPTKSGFIRHEHWVKQVRGQLETINADLKKASSSKDKQILTRAAGVLSQRLTEAGGACDRSGVWENRKLDCSLVVKVPASILPNAEADLLSESVSKRMLLGEDVYEFEPGVFDGKLMILIDQRTASSSEG
ncbi:MAG: hypothetical protein ABIU09_04800, partial [Pyrinomonadaceae bacterium]